MSVVAKFKSSLKIAGPGLAMTATGVGAGDLVAASLAGARFGMTLLWTVVAGVLLKYALSEGVARWQLATGTSLFEGWGLCLGRWVQFGFLAYLAFWSFIVGAALMSACGMAGHAIAPALSVRTWGILHGLVALGFTLTGNYRTFERVSKGLVGLMFVTLVGSALYVMSPWEILGQGLSTFSAPAGSSHSILSVMGGIGGSVSLLSYGYWMREKGWKEVGHLKAIRFDLLLCYLLTAIFGLALMTLATQLFYSAHLPIDPTDWVAQMGNRLRLQIGGAGYWIFVLGFWAAVTGSMLGTWQSLPYLFCDFVAQLKVASGESREAILHTGSRWYRGALFFLAIPPMGLLFLPHGQPLALIVLFTVVGAWFMPFLSATLLVMTSRSAWMPARLKGKWVANTVLGLSLLLFAYLCFRETGLTAIYNFPAN